MRKPEKRWIFIVDTADYAGNFEREIALYMTGIEPEHMSGGSDWIGEMARKELHPGILTDAELERFVSPVEGKNYVEIWGSPCEEGTYPNFNSVAIHMESLPDPKIFALLRDRAVGFTKLVHPRAWNKLEILGFRLLEITTTYEDIAIPE